jgi:hypothetical protein
MILKLVKLKSCDSVLAYLIYNKLINILKYIFSLASIIIKLFKADNPPHS